MGRFQVTWHRDGLRGILREQGLQLEGRTQRNRIQTMHSLRVLSLYIGVWILLAIAGKCNAQKILKAEHYRGYEEFGGYDSDDDPFKRPKHVYRDPQTASKVARRLVSNNTVAMINTQFEHGNDTAAMSFPEYAIDCFDNGDPILLFIRMSHNWRNIAAQAGYDSSVTYTVDIGEYDADWPGASPGSMYGMPRVNLRGHFRLLQVTGEDSETVDVDNAFDVRYISAEEAKSMEQCFLSTHRETGSWFPGDGNHVHSSVWTEFVVDSGYFVGGFGGYAYIGGLGSEEYHGQQWQDVAGGFHR